MDPGSLLMLAIVMAIFYFVLVRPQKKRMQQHSALLSSLAPGDEVVTIGGVCGFVNRIEDDMVFLEVSDGVEVRFTKQAVNRRIEAGETEERVEASDAPAEGEETAGS